MSLADNRTQDAVEEQSVMCPAPYIQEREARSWAEWAGGFSAACKYEDHREHVSGASAAAQQVCFLCKPDGQPWIPAPQVKVKGEKPDRLSPLSSGLHVCAMGVHPCTHINNK